MEFFQKGNIDVAVKVSRANPTTLPLSKRFASIEQVVGRPMTGSAVIATQPKL